MTIDTNKFKFFEKRLRIQGKLADRAEDVVDKFLKPVIKDEECREIVLDNRDFYISLINRAGDAANEFKQIFAKIANEEENTAQQQFAVSIGIDLESRSDEK